MNNFENYINNYFDKYIDCELKKAILYAIDGGKRFRPQIIFSILKGFNKDESLGYDAALALEMIQTYSLIHDDLPAMDNDDMRRGKPSLHKAFREDIAILAGDQLLTDSFDVIASSKRYDDLTKVKLISTLSRYSGIEGMIYGQLLDVLNSSKSINKELLDQIQDNKTAGLFKIACLMPMYICGINNENYYIELGSLIGKIFQNQDDLFDLIKTDEQMGKIHSDIANDKGTALSIYSIDELRSLINSQFNQLDDLLNKAEFNTSYIKEIIFNLKNR